MPHIGVAMLEGAGAFSDRRKNLFLHEQRADRRVAAAETFRNRYQIGADAFLFAGVQGAGSPHAAHHLI